ncbi:MAG: FlgD immunoglobulin-like domain containing protein, partial [Bacteroidota bacterium]|nr:FlgD immunoglobulin-like domain containing protein [Bacteroidota bacterium]
GLNDFRKYYWKIQGLGSGIRTQWSPAWNFTTIFNAPDNLKAAAFGKNSIKLTWKDNSSSETGYLIERKSGTVFAAIDTTLANATSYIDSILKIPGNYEYRVKAIAKDGASAYSNSASATVTAVNTPSGAPSDFVLDHNYPNPFNPATTIRYFLPEQSDVKLIIYDIQGMVIRSFDFHSQSAGYQYAVWDGKNSNNEQASSGTYICRLKAVTVNGKLYDKNLKIMLLK